ncbi:RusA-like Holliday junction resolvase [Ralstonia phage RS-PII-1]|uniref:DNA polymerase III beta sliding clamp central domain-containing protein n=1 Tax=Ralstonia phage RS-PII-1 TaxID=1932892 RepID=A0A1L7DQD4_9CAUD|nr:RusA-like Holliday junction resolvase [Ralstonia phage RS-PII-1]APU00328.1 hypothetical protein [Ralstonia phage RS-PII-1]
MLTLMTLPQPKLEKTMTTIRVSARALKAALILAAKGDIRYYLNGVKIEAGTNETRLIATDGHLLGAFREQQDNGVPLGEEVGFIIPRDVIDGMKLTKAATKTTVLSINVPDDGGLYELHNGPMVQRFAAVDGLFPQYRRVIPAIASDNSPASLNINLLARMGDAIQIFRDYPKFPAMRMDSGGTTANGLSNCTVIRTDSEDFVGVIMPLREECNVATSWVQGNATSQAEPLKEAA